MFARLSRLSVFLVVAACGHAVAGDEANKPQAIPQRTLPIDDRPRSPIFDLPVLGQQPIPAAAPVQPKVIYVSFDPEDHSGWGGVPVPKLLDVLKDNDSDLRRLACDALGARGKGGSAGIAALAIAARDPVGAVRRCAVSALGKIGRDLLPDQQAIVSARIVPALVTALADQRLTVRLRAISALGGLKVSSQTIESALLGCLQQPLTRDDALLALVQRDFKHEIPLELLAATVRNGKTGARRCALDLIMDRDPKNPEVRALLVELAKRGDAEVRLVAATRLWELEPTLRNLDVLSVVLKRTPGDIAQALNTPDSDVLDTLDRLARTGDPGMRAVAGKVLQKVDRVGLRVSALIRALDNPRPDVREGAARALGKLGPKAKIAVPALARHLADENDLVRLCSAYALTSIGRDASAAVPDLQHALTQSDPALRSAAAHALASIVPSDKSK